LKIGQHLPKLWAIK